VSRARPCPVMRSFVVADLTTAVLPVKLPGLLLCATSFLPLRLKLDSRAVVKK
jgi:hypothetical protein